MEKVLVVPTELVSDLLGKNDFVTDKVPDFIKIVNENHLYVDRDYAEYAAEYKQIIPYAILKNGDKIFLTQRLKKQTEKRLHGRCSFGLGGHINPAEEESDNILLAGMRRELAEEVGLIEVPDCTCVGIINDCSTEVSNYHIGLVYVIPTTADVRVLETQKMTGHWATAAEISETMELLESWSQITWKNHDKWDR